jgi:hypothetical protein
VLDGVLDDEIWSGAPMPTGTWVSYNPLRGEPAQHQTVVWIGYDDEAIYFAFRCHDPEPQSIRTTISRRDSAWNDDDLAYDVVDFQRKDTGERVFRIHIVNLRNTYQFNRQFFVRLISQLDTSRRRMLNDALASYELVPGTVVHFGYGTILEGQERGNYAPTARAIFFKASYLTRF